MPAFIRREPFTNRAWRVEFSDTDPNKRIREEQIPTETIGLEEDSLAGAGAAETILTMLLG
jgi:hypothetical protein